MGSDGNKRLFGGAGRDWTGDLVNAIHARSQLRHSPTFLSNYIFIINNLRNLYNVVLYVVLFLSVAQALTIYQQPLSKSNL